MMTDDTTTEEGAGEQSRRRRRRRRHRHRESTALIRVNRITEMWIVAIVSLFVLGAGITWIVAVAYQPPTEAEDNVNLSSPDNSPAGGQPAVVIIQDNSAKSDAPDK